jgi:hypothetical protein
MAGSCTSPASTPAAAMSRVFTGEAGRLDRDVEQVVWGIGNCSSGSRDAGHPRASPTSGQQQYGQGKRARVTSDILNLHSASPW